MRTKSYLIALFLVVLASGIRAQVSPDSSQMSALKAFSAKYDSSLIVHWQKRSGTADIITFGKPHSFSQDPLTSAQTFLRMFGDIIKERSGIDELREEKVQTNQNIHYVRFKQYYEGIPVVGGEYVVTVLPGGKVESALGGFFKNITVDKTPKLSVQQALSSARQNPPPSVSLKDSMTFYRLVVFPADTGYSLAWEIQIPPTQGIGEWIYEIDASAGTVLSRRSTLLDGALPAMLPPPQGSVYLHHPLIDPSWTTVNLVYINSSGYLSARYGTSKDYFLFGLPATLL